MHEIARVLRKLHFTKDPREMLSNFPRNYMKGYGHIGIPIESGFSGKRRRVLV